MTRGKFGDKRRIRTAQDKKGWKSMGEAFSEVKDDGGDDDYDAVNERGGQPRDVR